MNVCANYLTTVQKYIRFGKIKIFFQYLIESKNKQRKIKFSKKSNKKTADLSISGMRTCFLLQITVLWLYRQLSEWYQEPE